MTTTTFNPSAAQRSQAIDLLCNPAISLTDVAQRLAAPFDALAAWVALPATQAVLASVESLLHLRARLVGASTLPALAAALARIISATNTKAPPGATPEQARQAHETIRRAGALLTRLARMTPGPSSAPVARASPARESAPCPSSSPAKNIPTPMAAASVAAPRAFSAEQSTEILLNAAANPAPCVGSHYFDAFEAPPLTVPCTPTRSKRPNAQRASPAAALLSRAGNPTMSDQNRRSCPQGTSPPAHSALPPDES